MGFCGNVIRVLALGFGPATAGSLGKLTVLVYNYGNVPAATLADAQAFATKSYRAAGIELTWEECPISDDDNRRVCSPDQANNGRPLFLRLIPETMVAGAGGRTDSEEVLGVAYDSFAFVFYERIQSRALAWRVPEYVLLGRSMAHELGHLILGQNSHAPTGLMRRRFAKEDLVLQSGQFLFDPMQARRLREWLRGGNRQ